MTFKILELVGQGSTKVTLSMKDIHIWELFQLCKFYPLGCCSGLFKFGPRFSFLCVFCFFASSVASQKLLE